MNSKYFGKKHNIGVKQAIISDILIAFVTNEEYEWPVDNLRIIYQGEIIGRDVSAPAEIEKYRNSNDHCVVGNIVVNFSKMRDLRNTTEPPLMVINGSRCKKIESLSFVSDAFIASPSRLSDSYIKSKITCEGKPYIGSFLVGLKIEEEALKNSLAGFGFEN